MALLQAEYSAGSEMNTSYHHGGDEGISVTDLFNGRICVSMLGTPRLRLFISKGQAAYIRDQISSLLSPPDPTPAPTTAELAECSPLEEVAE